VARAGGALEELAPQARGLAEDLADGAQDVENDHEGSFRFRG